MTQPVEKRYDTFWPRFGAGFLDGFVLVPVSLLEVFCKDHADSLPAATVACVVVLHSLIFYAYSILMHWRFGQTVGKMLMGVRVISVREKRLTLWQAFARDAVPFVLSMALLLGFYVPAILRGMDINKPKDPVVVSAVLALGCISLGWLIAELVTMLTNARRRAVHDLIAGSVVVRLDESQMWSWKTRKDMSWVLLVLAVAYYFTWPLWNYHLLPEYTLKMDHIEQDTRTNRSSPNIVCSVTNNHHHKQIIARMTFEDVSNELRNRAQPRSLKPEHYRHYQQLDGGSGYRYSSGGRAVGNWFGDYWYNIEEWSVGAGHELISDPTLSVKGELEIWSESKVSTVTLKSIALIKGSTFKLNEDAITVRGLYSRIGESTRIAVLETSATATYIDSLTITNSDGMQIMTNLISEGSRGWSEPCLIDIQREWRHIGKSRYQFEVKLPPGDGPVDLQFQCRELASRALIQIDRTLPVVEKEWEDDFMPFYLNGGIRISDGTSNTIVESATQLFGKPPEISQDEDLNYSFFGALGYGPPRIRPTDNEWGESLQAFISTSVSMAVEPPLYDMDVETEFDLRCHVVGPGSPIATSMTITKIIDDAGRDYLNPGEYDSQSRSAFGLWKSGYNTSQNICYELAISPRPLVNAQTIHVSGIIRAGFGQDLVTNNYPGSDFKVGAAFPIGNAVLKLNRIEPGVVFVSTGNLGLLREIKALDANGGVIFSTTVECNSFDFKKQWLYCGDTMPGLDKISSVIITHYQKCYWRDLPFEVDIPLGEYRRIRELN